MRLALKTLKTLNNEIEGRRDEYHTIGASDEDNAARFYPRKGGNKHYEDIKLGQAITKLLNGDDQSKLRKYLRPDNAYLPSNDGTIALIQRIRRELNLPGNKGVDPKSETICSDLERELVDEDIAYVDEMALDYNSFILENKEASATWPSEVDLPRLGSSVFRNLASESNIRQDSSVFRNIANESNMMRSDPMATSPILQNAVTMAGVKSPAKNEWMEIFDGSPAVNIRQEQLRRREEAINKKSPYYQSAQSLSKVSVSRSSDNFFKVGNPCSASNMRARNKLNSHDGTPTLQSTMKVKSKDKSQSTFEVLVPKTNNGLKIQFAQSGKYKIRTSLGIKAFAPDSNIVKQGILKIGDEILEVNSVPVKGKYIDDITGIIARDTDAFILLLVRRTNTSKSTHKPVVI